MHMVHLAKRWTVEDVQTLPDDGNRYEVVDGELLVTPAPSHAHQRMVLALAHRLMHHLGKHGPHEVLVSPAEVRLGANAMVQPDLFVVPRPAGRPSSWSELALPLLVVEVLSPSTARSDRFVKRRLYQREGILEYWIVDLDARAIERWRPADERPELLDDRIEWQPSEAEAPFVLELEPLFREVLDG